MKIFKIVSVSIFLLLIWACTERSRDDMTNPNPNPNPTEIGGSLSGVLPKANSPYKVVDNIVVGSSTTLTIEKGVLMWFTDSAMLVVYGRLVAAGAPSNVITFTAFENRWKGIRVINSNQNSVFRFCICEKIERLDSSQYGGIEINNSTVIIQNCSFRNNRSVQGGGLSLVSDSSFVTNNIFRENYAVAYGGGILAHASSARIINNTVYNNHSDNVGGGLVLYDPLAVDIQNNIFFENTANTGDPRIWLAHGDSSGFGQQFNFLPVGNQDPRFISNDNLRLQAGSPCANAGNPDSIFDDIDGSRNDQGAYGGPQGNW